MSSLLNQILDFVSLHKFSVGLALFFLVRWFMGGNGGKFEEYPGHSVIAVTNDNVWKDAIVAAKQNNKLVVVDFYATWCPPVSSSLRCMGVKGRSGCLIETVNDWDSYCSHHLYIVLFCYSRIL